MIFHVVVECGKAAVTVTIALTSERLLSLIELT